MRILKKLGKSFVVIGLCGAIAGCDIRPLPTSLPSIKRFETEEGVITPTTAIVRRIRCEARAAIAKITMSYIKEDLVFFENQIKAGKITGSDLELYRRITQLDDESNKISVTFDSLIEEFNFDAKRPSFKKRFMNWAARNQKKTTPAQVPFVNSLKVLSLFARSGVAYEFTFDITENNDAVGGALNFGFTGSSSSTNVNLGGNYQRSRQNVRSFKFTETIGDIVNNRVLRHQFQFCNEIDFDETQKTNAHLPIYGAINILDSFSTFAALLVETDFAAPPKDNKGDELTIRTDNLAKLSAQDLLDVINFTTTINGSIDPTITLSGSRALNTASVNLAAGRIDRHSLTLLLQPNGIENALEKLELNQIRAEDDNIILLNN